MIKLRDYQEEISDKAADKLRKLKIVMLAMSVRTWKTFTALATIEKYWAKNVLFLTKKKAISSIEDDYSHYKDKFNLTVINYESVHKVEWKFDLLVCDESHWTLSWFPKPSKTNKEVKKRFSKLPLILLSWTPLIESAWKAYPQFNISENSPFKKYTNFYKWFKDYWIPKQIRTAYWMAMDYSETKYDDIMEVLNPYIITYTQKEAWFTTEINEQVLEVEMKPETYWLIKRLIKDRVIEWENDTILADTWVKLQICLHQMFSWTIKLESWNAITIDETKARFIYKKFKWKKIAIMYNFIQEKVLLKEIFWDSITDDLQEFKTTNKSYMGQIVSTREWVSLREADALIFYNIPFSWVSYVQWRDRLSYMWRKENNVYIIAAKRGIEKKIYKVVKNKQTFSNKIFKKEFNIC